MYYHDPLDPDTIRTDDEARDAREARALASDRPGMRIPPAATQPRPHCLTFRVEISAELPSPVLDTVTLARETSYDGHRAEPLRIMQALEPLVLSLLSLMQAMPGNVADTEETAGALTVTIGSPRARGEVARRFSFATTLKAERGEDHNRPYLREQFTDCIMRACRDYDLLSADEFPGSAAVPSGPAIPADTTPACC